MTSAQRDDLLGLGRVRRPGRVLGRAVGARGRRRNADYARPDEPRRRVQLPRAVPAATMRSWSSSRPAACTRSRCFESLALRGERDAVLARATSRPLPACRRAGIAETFPLDGARTLYGATKLAAELLIDEYAAAFGAAHDVIDRCGVDRRPVADGEGRPGRVRPLGARATISDRPLSYIGYGGSGKQVRDLLHVDDLIDLLDEQLVEPERWAGVVVERRRRRRVSLSLLETTELCRELTGRERRGRVRAAERRPGDVRIYVSDCSRLFALTDWRPQRDARAILEDTHDLDRRANERALRAALDWTAEAVVPSRSSPARAAWSAPSPCALRRVGLRRRRDRERHAGRFFGPRRRRAATDATLVERLRRVPLARRRHPRRGRRSSASSRDTAAQTRARRSTPPRSRHTTGPPRTADRLRGQRQRHPEPARGDAAPRARTRPSSSCPRTRSTATARTRCRSSSSRRGSSCPATTAYFDGIDDLDVASTSACTRCSASRRPRPTCWCRSTAATSGCRRCASAAAA